MTRAENYVTVEFLSRSSNEGFARTAAAAFAAQLDPTLDELGDIKTAVSEAVTNAIVHAYPDALGRIVMKMKLLKDGVLELTVRDWAEVSPTWRRPAVRCLPPAAASAVAWASPSWRVLWTSSLSAQCRAKALRSRCASVLCPVWSPDD